MARLDYNLDPDIMRWVVNKLRHKFWDIKSSGNKEFTLAELIDALVKNGVKLITNEEEVQSTHARSFFYGYEHEIVRFQNYDCTLQGIKNDISIAFANYPYEIHASPGRYPLGELVKFFLGVDSAMPHYIKQGEEYILGQRKKEKMLEINQNTVATIVRTTLKNTGIKYKLDLNRQQAFLTLKLDNGLETKVRLPYKSFMEKIPHVVNLVNQLNQMMETIGQPIRIKATYSGYAANDDWIEST